MCQAMLGGGGHRMGLNWRYRHPLGSLRPFVARFRLTYYDGWSAPAPLGFFAGGSGPSDGRTEPGGGSQTSVYVGPVVWTGLCYSSIIRSDGCNVFREETFYG